MGQEELRREDTAEDEQEEIDGQKELSQSELADEAVERKKESSERSGQDSFLFSFTDGAKIKDTMTELQDMLKTLGTYRSNLVINNYGIIAGDDADIHNVHIGNRNKESRNKSAMQPEQLELWIVEHYNQYDTALLIACAVFYDMPYIWISEASESLYVLFDDSKIENIGKIARSHSIRMFGAEICQGTMNTYAGEVEVECVCFSENAQIFSILKTVWNEFPQMRKILVLWLKKYIIGERKIMCERSRDILGYLAGLDYYFFVNKMQRWIISEESFYDDLVLVQVIAVLYQQERFKNNLDNMVKSWSRLKNVHYLLLAMLVCVLIEDNSEYLRSAIKIYINEAFDAIQKREENKYIKSLLGFFAAGMRKVVFYRLLVEELYEIAQRKNSYQEKRVLCFLFLELFSKDIVISCFKSEIEEEAVLIKLVLINSPFRDKLCFLWNFVWKENRYRMVCYDMLSQYYAYIPSKEERRLRIEAFVKATFSKSYSKVICLDIMKKIEMKCKNYEA